MTTNKVPGYRRGYMSEELIKKYWEIRSLDPKKVKNQRDFTHQLSKVDTAEMMRWLK